MGGLFRERWDYSNAVSEVFFAIIDGQNTLTKILASIHENKAHTTVLMHLRKLEKEGMISGKKKGRTRIYSVVWENVIRKFITDILTTEKEINLSGIEEMPELKKNISKLKKLENVHKNPLISGLIRAYIEGYADNVMVFHEKISFIYCVSDFTWKLKLMKKDTETIIRDRRKGDKIIEELVEFLKYMTHEASYTRMTTDTENVEEYLKKVFK